MRFFKHIIIFLTFITLPVAADNHGPDDFLKASVTEVMDFITNNKSQLDQDDEYLVSKMNEIVIPKLDIELMSKIVLGKNHWNNISISEKSDFMNAFKNLMVRTYMKSLTAFEGEKIKFLPYTQGKRDDVAKVKSIYLLNEGELPVSYRLKKTDSKWKVYDIIIDGVSLLRNYRSDFKAHVSKKGISSLINQLNRN